MVKINFKEVRVFLDVAHKVAEVRDMREQVANDLYQNGQGIAFHALALKIYNSQGGVELDDKEYSLLVAYAEQMCTPAAIDAIKSFEPQEEDNKE